MYCEKKGGDCGYLGLLDDLKKDLLVESGFESDEAKATVMGTMGETADKARAHSQALDCRDDFCGVVGYAIVSTFELEARQQQASE